MLWRDTELLSPKLADRMHARLVEPEPPGLVLSGGIGGERGAGEDGGIGSVVRVADRGITDQLYAFGTRGFFELLARFVVVGIHPEVGSVAERL